VARAKDLAAKIDALIVAAGSPSYEALAREIKDMGGPTVSAAYLWQLRTGARDNPTFQHLQALARYFSEKLAVPVTLQYFDPETPVDQPWRDVAGRNQVVALPERQSSERDIARQLAERGIERISARYGEMGPNMLRDILAIMEELAARDRSAGEGNTRHNPPGESE
jgi:transcriptional regulator with XRE-family HTH domain